MNFARLIKDIVQAQTVILSTHRQCDGDGLGAQIALFHALKKMGKKVRVLNVDETPKKYSFLNTDKIVQHAETRHDPIGPTDLVLIFDTNDFRLLEPLFSQFKASGAQILFIDHHPVLEQGPAPTQGSHIDTSAASTGEIAHQIIEKLKVPLDQAIAQALYTSIVFDTQLFRFIRGSAQSHLIAAELLKYDIMPEEIHRRIFGNFTVKKVSFMAQVLSQIEYFADGQIACLRLHKRDLIDHSMEIDESRDVVDFIMNIETLEAAVLFREDGPATYKVSMRSKGGLEVLPVAEAMGGGGHKFSSGASLKGPYEQLKTKVVDALVLALSGALKDPLSGALKDPPPGSIKDSLMGSAKISKRSGAV